MDRRCLPVSAALRRSFVCHVGCQSNPFNKHLRTLVEAGLSKRIMFGSDQMRWPEAIGLAVDAIQTAEFLTDAQKADIFYNNAARFLRLSEEEIARHHSP